MPTPETHLPLRGLWDRADGPLRDCSLKASAMEKEGNQALILPLAHYLCTLLPNSSCLEPAFIPTAPSNSTSLPPEREKTLFDLLFSNFSSQLLPSIFWRILKQRCFSQSSIFSCYSGGPCMKNHCPSNINEKCHTWAQTIWAQSHS